MKVNLPFCSVFMVTYNHEKYIAQAIEGVINQQTNFLYQLIIGEDCSTDNTREICIEYKKKYPDKIKLLLHKKNLGKEGKNNTLAVYNECNGKYIAMCEADDYWTDPHKLQKQVDFLEANPKYSICTHNVLVSTEEGNGNILQQHEWPGKDRKQVYTIKDLLMFGSGGATCSLVFLTKCVANPHELFNEISPSDTTLQIICAQYGNLYYMKEVMGVYRRHPKGITSAYSNITLFDDYGVQTWKKLNNFLGRKYQYEVDHLLFYYYYPNLLKAYKEAGKKWHYRLLQLRRKRLQLKYSFKILQKKDNESIKSSL